MTWHGRNRNSSLSRKTKAYLYRNEIAEGNEIIFASHVSWGITKVENPIHLQGTMLERVKVYK